MTLWTRDLSVSHLSEGQWFLVAWKGENRGHLNANATTVHKSATVFGLWKHHFILWIWWVIFLFKCMWKSLIRNMEHSLLHEMFLPSGLLEFYLKWLRAGSTLVSSSTVLRSVNHSDCLVRCDVICLESNWPLKACDHDSGFFFSSCY